MEDKELERRFKLHGITTLEALDVSNLRLAGLDFARLINELCPEGREKSIALTDLEAAAMYAIKAIASKEKMTDDSTRMG